MSGSSRANKGCWVGEFVTSCDGNRIGSFADDTTFRTLSSDLTAGEIGGDSGPCGCRLSDMTASRDLGVFKTFLVMLLVLGPNDSSLGASGGDIKLLISRGFLGSDGWIDMDAMMDG